MPGGYCADAWIALILAAASMTAQAPAPRGGIVEGRVVNRISGEPVRKATVLLTQATSPSSDTYMAPVDSNGRFRIEGVVPANYRTGAQAPRFGYVPARAPLPTPITVAEGQHLTDVVIQLTPLGAISGRVLDSDGDPVSNAAIEPMQYAYMQNDRQLVSRGMRAVSDDRGQYRLFDLPPGRYYVRASRERPRMEPLMVRGPVRGPRLPEGFVQTYYPGALDPADTAPVEVAPGGEVRGIDIRLIPSVYYSVRGTLEGLNDPESRPMLRLERQPRGFSGYYPVTTRDNSFEFTNVLPGSYVIIAERRQGERSLARQAIEVVDRDIEGIHLTLSPALDLRGVVKANEPLRQPLEKSRIVALATSSDSGNRGAEIKPDGSFLIRDLLPEVYRLEVAPISGGYLKSLRIGEQELPGQEIDLTRGSTEITVLLGTDGGKLEGQVVDAKGQPVPGALLSLPSLTRGGGFRAAVADAKGTFKFEDLPPGPYRLFAWLDVEPGAPRNVAFRQPYIKQATVVKVEPNSTQTVKLTAISVK